MTGLDPDNDVIIEMATIVTDSQLNVLAEGPVIAVHQSDEVLARMDEWNTRQHGGSGLTQRVRESRISTAEAERLTLEFLEQWVPGASRRSVATASAGPSFLYRQMPTLEAYFHYRNLDVSTLKELAARWAPQIMEGFKKGGTHRRWTTSATPSPSCVITASISSRSDRAASAASHKPQKNLMGVASMRETTSTLRRLQLPACYFPNLRSSSDSTMRTPSPSSSAGRQSARARVQA